MITEIGRSGTIRMSLGSKALVPVVFALLLGGCPKRQTGPRVVYVQPPAPAAASTSTKAGPSVPPEILTIEAPPPAPEEPTAPPATSSTSTTVPTQPLKRPPRPRTDSRPAGEPATPDTAPADAAQAPPLEPAGSAASEDEIAANQATIRRRIDGLNSSYYSTAADRQILDDARAFVNQSEQALKEHNLLKAHELVQKASLLLDALQPRP